MRGRQGRDGVGTGGEVELAGVDVGWEEFVPFGLLVEKGGGHVSLRSSLGICGVVRVYISRCGEVKEMRCKVTDGWMEVVELWDDEVSLPSLCRS